MPNTQRNHPTPRNDTALLLRRAGLRVTRPRRLLLDSLGRMGGHRSVRELARALAADRTPLGRASLYGVVADLEAHGLLTLTDVGLGRVVCELARQPHHHFLCRQCGKIIDIPYKAPDKSCVSLRDFAGEVEQTQVILRGRCPDCVRAKKRKGGAKASTRPTVVRRRNRSRSRKRP